MFVINCLHCRLQCEYVVQVSGSSVPSQHPRKSREETILLGVQIIPLSESQVISVTPDDLWCSSLCPQHSRCSVMVGLLALVPYPCLDPPLTPLTSRKDHSGIQLRAVTDSILLVQLSGRMPSTGQGACEQDPAWPSQQKVPALDQEAPG